MQFISFILHRGSSWQFASIRSLAAQCCPQSNLSQFILERRSLPIMAPHSTLSDGWICSVVSFLLSDASHLDLSIKSFNTFPPCGHAIETLSGTDTITSISRSQTTCDSSHPSLITHHLANLLPFIRWQLTIQSFTILERSFTILER